MPGEGQANPEGQRHAATGLNSVLVPSVRQSKVMYLCDPIRSLSQTNNRPETATSGYATWPCSVSQGFLHKKAVHRAPGQAEGRGWLVAE